MRFVAYARGDRHGLGTCRSLALGEPDDPLEPGDLLITATLARDGAETRR